MKRIAFVLAMAFSLVVFISCSEDDDNTIQKVSSNIECEDIAFNNENFRVEVKVEEENSTVIKAELFLDGKSQGSKFETPYLFYINTKDEMTGEHSLHAILTTNTANEKTDVKTFVLKAKLGTEYQGGVVINVSDDGFHGIIAAKQDVPGGRDGQFQWGFRNKGYGAYSKTDGFENTQKFIKQSDEYFAAIACLNYREGGYDDWYLPSVEEFKYLKDFEDELITPRLDNMYWTSTQIDEEHAEVGYFGRVAFVEKDLLVWGNYYYVRAFRKF